MRLRNVKNAEKIICTSRYLINNLSVNKSKWCKVFDNNNPIYVEIGMGKGDFIISEAMRNPSINYVGIEKYPSIILRAISKLKELDLNNLKLICFDAKEIESLFGKEISKIYLNFSDPWPKNKHRDRRLTSPKFINRYKNIVKDKLIIEMKTDNDLLFEYSLREFKKLNFDIKELNRDYGNNEKNYSKTEYEKKFIKKNKNINYVEAELKSI